MLIAYFRCNALKRANVVRIAKQKNKKTKHMKTKKKNSIATKTNSVNQNFGRTTIILVYGSENFATDAGIS